MNKNIPLLATLLLSSSSLAQSTREISTLGCMLEPSKKIEVSSPIASVIDSIPVKRGEKIKKGQLLFKYAQVLKVQALT